MDFSKFKNPKIVIASVVLFMSSLLLFLYLSFPYGVLKEAIAAQVQAATGVTIRMESFGPSFPIGFAANGVEVYTGNSPHLKLKSISANLSILQIFLGRLGVAIEIEDPKGSELDLGVGFGMLDLIKGNLGMPSVVSLKTKGFNIDSLVSFGIRAAVDNGVGGPMAGPLLANLGVKGRLAGTVDLNLGGQSPAQATGEIKLGILDAVLVLSDPSLNFPDQVFKTAQISAKIQGGTLNVDPTTRFSANDIELGLDGKVALRQQFSSSDLSLNAFVKLQGILGEQYSFILDGISGGLSKGGSLNLQIAGTLGAPQFNPN
jgi:hypothetical protein